MYTLKNITKTYNTKVLNSINLEINEGITVILGPSGSGKSTLLNILGGIDKQSEGTIFYNDKLLKPNEMRKQVSFIFQNYNLFNELNVVDNIKIGCFKKVDINKILKDLDIEDIKNKYPYELSGGEQQRVAIARSIARKSNIILADEPTGALDLKNSLNVLRILIGLNKNIIIVTHNELIKYLGDTIIYLNSGNIVSIEKNIRKNIEDIKWV